MQLSPRRPTVFRPSGAAHMRALRRFWYQVKVAEFGQQLDVADHDALELSDPLCADGEIFALRTEEQIIGTAILVRCTASSAQEHAALYDMSSLGAMHPQRSSILTGVELARDHRRASALYLLLAEVYRFALAVGLQILATDTDDTMLGPMLDLGFLPWGGSFDDPERGRRYVLKFDCHNLQHLADMQSPLEKIAQHWAAAVANGTDINQSD